MRQSEPPEPLDPEDLLPAVCECGFEAETLEAMDDHEHPRYWFMVKDGEPEGECYVCGAPAPESDRPDAPEFCDDHDADDLRELEAAMERQSDRDTGMVIPEREGE